MYIQRFAALGLVSIGTLLPTVARADCGIAPASWQGRSAIGSDSLRPASDDGGNDPIVGMWHVTFVAMGNQAPLPPDGVVVDNGFAQWHSDGTEIMNSSRSPATQSFCLGVWKRVGSSRYKLNHFAISWDPNADPDHPLGPANIREEVVLSSNGRTFSGTFTIDQYDQAGNLLVHLAGQVNGRRVSVHTRVNDLL
jgi:hypothetical protein